MIVYTLGRLTAPLWAWLYTATCDQTRPARRMRHARTWSRPHPLRQRHRGSRVRPRGYCGRHVLTAVTA